jgi:hypothetical protein
MLERVMEDLIAANPDHFFPRHGFVLQGRQQSFRGVGRFDLLFTDRHRMNILMELKAVPAKWETIDQVVRYRDALVEKGSTNIIMWIVAPKIPFGLRDFLDHVGVEYSEIHETEFRRVAAIMGYNLSEISDATPQAAQVVELQSVPKPQFPSSTISSDGGTDEWGFGLATQPSYLLRALEQGKKTKEEIRLEFINHFYPGMEYSEAKSKSGFGVFFSDSKRPVGTYHASRSLLILKDSAGRLSLDDKRSRLVKAAIKRGILSAMRGLDFKKDKERFDRVLEEFGLPNEPKE